MRAASLLILLALCPPASAQKPVTKYEGRPLDHWVSRFRTADNEKDRHAAEKAVIAFGPDAAPCTGALLEMFDDGSESYRQHVANMLCAIGPGAKGAVPDLIKLLEEKSPRDPHQVIRVLCAIGPDAKGAIPVIRRVVLQNLAGKGDKRAPLWNFSNNGSQEYDFANLGAEAVPMLLDIIEAPTSRHYPAVNGFDSLQELGASGKAAAPRLVRLLTHADPSIRLQAARTLWAVDKNPAAIPALAGLLKGDDHRLGEAAAEALGEIGPDAKDALPALKAVLPKDEPAQYAPTAPAVYPSLPGGGRQAARDAIRKIEQK
jgi:HEAT repeat protein